MNDKRESDRMPMLLFVRGLGSNRDWVERMGDLSIEGVGFDYATAPTASEFEVSFRLPGESERRSVLAEVTETRPCRALHFVGARISSESDEVQRAIARSLDARRLKL